jgi:hypothetical protein
MRTAVGVAGSTRSGIYTQSVGIFGRAGARSLGTFSFGAAVGTSIDLGYLDVLFR